VCLDFFEELGSVHCGNHDAGPPPPAPAPPPPAPAPPAVKSPPAVNEKVYHHLVSQFSRGHAMFQHFGVSTFGHNNTLGVGGSNDCWHGPTTKPDKMRAPCLPAELFNPTNYSAEQTMQVAAAFGASEVCITAHHEGGFTLWPSNFSGYGVHHSAWKGGRGDILAEFAAAARAAGIRICYYIGPNANGWMLSQNYSAEEFLSAQLGEFRELLSDPRYGPVHRLWIDHPWQTCHNYSHDAPGPPSNPRYTACPPLTKDGAQTFPMAQLRFNALVKQLSPSTIMGGSEYWNGPTRPQYPFWYYCNRSHATIEESGCWAPPVSHNECSDAHGPAGDSFREIFVCLPPHLPLPLAAQVEGCYLYSGGVGRGSTRAHRADRVSHRGLVWPGRRQGAPERRCHVGAVAQQCGGGRWLDLCVRILHPVSPLRISFLPETGHCSPLHAVSFVWPCWD
jgi:hypothetical protein